MKLNGFQWSLVGINIVATLLVSVGIGILLDNKYNSKPKFILIFLAFGVISVFLTFWRINQKLSQSEKKKNDNK